MSVLLLTIPISLILVAIAVAVFFWAVNSGQYDDLDSPAYIVLLDDDPEQLPGRRPQPGDGEGAAEEGSDEGGDEGSDEGGEGPPPPT